MSNISDELDEILGEHIPPTDYTNAPEKDGVVDISGYPDHRAEAKQAILNPIDRHDLGMAATYSAKLLGYKKEITTLKAEVKEARIDEVNRLKLLALPYVCNGNKLADGVPVQSLDYRLAQLKKGKE